MKYIILLFVFLPVICFTQIRVEDFTVQGEKDDALKINRAMRHLDSIGHGALEFDGTKIYRLYSTVELPRYMTKGKRLFIFNGNGCTIVAKNNAIRLFNRMPLNQKEALNNMMSTRFTINDFTFIGGEKGVNLGATYGSSINRCNFVSQSVAAVDVQFGLNTSIYLCHSNNAFQDNFILRTGEDWGGTNANSQSNHSVISMCRVYARKGAYSAYKILGSGGVVLRDNISEGHKEIKFSVFFNDQGSNHVRFFKIENFHLEHAPSKVGIYLRSIGNIVIDGLYYQLSYKDFPVIRADKRTRFVQIKNVPWYVPGSVIRSESKETRWLLESNHASLSTKQAWLMRKGRGKWSHELPIKYQVISVQ